MKESFEQMKALAFDPFAALAAAPAARAGRATFDAEHARAIANGAWAECEGCCDPGPDRFPEDVRAVG
jgi:hypothetical protein